MNPQIQFRNGKPLTFTATRTFDLGNTGLKVPRGGEIMFDGTMVSFEGHPPVVMPQLRGAIKMGWLVTATDYNPNAPATRPISARMQVRPAEGGNPMAPRPRQDIDTSQVESEEREVGNVGQHAQQTRNRNATNYRLQGGEVVKNGRGEMEVIEDQEGVQVGQKLKTPAQQKTNLEKTNPYTAIQEANSVRIDPGQGRTREDMMAEMTEDQRQEYEASIMSKKAAYAPEDASMIVGRVPAPKTRHTEGFSVRGAVGGGVETADLGGTGIAGQDQVSVVEENGIKFTNTNGPKRNVRLVSTQAEQQPAPQRANGNGHVHIDAHDAMCRQIAKRICRDFPDNYVFSDPLRKKIARLQADYDDRLDVILAVAAADTDPEVRERLLHDFPEAFAAE